MRQMISRETLRFENAKPLVYIVQYKLRSSTVNMQNPERNVFFVNYHFSREPNFRQRVYNRKRRTQAVERDVG